MSKHRHYSNWLNSEGRDAQHQYIIRNNARLKSPSLRSKILLMPKRNLKGSPIIIYKNYFETEIISCTAHKQRFTMCLRFGQKYLIF